MKALMNYDITIKKNSAPWVFSIYAEDDNNVPYDLEGVTASMQIRRAKHSEPALITLTVGDGVSIEPVGEDDEPEKGVVRLEINEEKMGALNISCGVYDILMTDTNGMTVVLAEGKAIVDIGTTRMEN